MKDKIILSLLVIPFLVFLFWDVDLYLLYEDIKTSTIGVVLFICIGLAVQYFNNKKAQS